MLAELLSMIRSDLSSPRHQSTPKVGCFRKQSHPMTGLLPTDLQGAKGFRRVTLRGHRYRPAVAIGYRCTGPVAERCLHSDFQDFQVDAPCAPPFGLNPESICAIRSQFLAAWTPGHPTLLLITQPLNHIFGAQQMSVVRR